MVEFMNRHKIRPIVDKVFEFSEAKEAFSYLDSQQHFGKVVIRIHDLPRAATLGNRSVLRLQAFDKVLTKARFPRLWSFFLEVGITEDLYDTWGYKVDSEHAACRALRGAFSTLMFVLLRGRHHDSDSARLAPRGPHSAAVSAKVFRDTQIGH